MISTTISAPEAAERDMSSLNWDKSSLDVSPKSSTRSGGEKGVNETYDSSALRNSPSGQRGIGRMAFELDEAKYVELLRKLIDESESVQNCPPLGLVPREDNIVRHVLDYLQPYSAEAGGPLIIEHLSVCEGRGNLVVTYPGTAEGEIMSFIGSHMDVVPADPAAWSVDPFHLTVDGDKLYGRGTTDCLGHVALMTSFFEALALNAPATERSIVCVLIASEEAESVPTPECGVEVPSQA